MNRPQPDEEKTRFSGNLRHYHRTGSQNQRTWDDWVDGTRAKARSSRNWVRIFAICVALLALGGIIAGLIIELR